MSHAVYTIHVGAVLGPEWSEWFDGADIVGRADGTGLVTVMVRDEAMLFGLLNRIRDLRVPLLGLYPGRDHAAMADWLDGGHARD